MQPDGGSAVPIVTVDRTTLQGNVAIPVYKYNAYPTDRPVGAGYPRPVVEITDADLVGNGGQYSLDGRAYAMPVYESEQVAQTGDVPLIVYVVNP